MEDPEVTVRSSAVQAIMGLQLPLPAQDAIVNIVERMERSSDSDERMLAVKAYVAIGAPVGERRSELLIKALVFSDSPIRRRAAELLGRLGAEATDALPLLEQMAKTDPFSSTREAASIAVTQILNSMD